MFHVALYEHPTVMMAIRLTTEVAIADASPPDANITEALLPIGLHLL